MSKSKMKYPYPSVFHYLPRNDEDYQGGLVLYSTSMKTFYSMVFGTGDNLTQEYVDEGFDDYMLISAFEVDGEVPLLELVSQVKEGVDIDEITGVSEVESTMMLIRRAEYKGHGDVRAYVANALDMLGYNMEEEGCRDLMYIATVK